MADIRLRHHFPSRWFVAIAAIVVALFVAAFIYFGAYNIAADSPHTRPVFALLESLRDRSIAVHARGITPPADLASAERISAALTIPCQQFRYFFAAGSTFTNPQSTNCPP